jgi:hypothetical protein
VDIWANDIMNYSKMNESKLYKNKIRKKP